MITIIMNNACGEIDRQTAETPAQAVEVAIQMIRDAGELYGGDTIVIEED